tara:strand:- start:4375 stop:4638 length:264 start_codon:yes stop_codon:yes gene_type:complete
MTERINPTEDSIEFKITPMNIGDNSNDPLTQKILEIAKEFNHDYNFLLLYVDKNGHFRFKAKDENRQSILEMLQVTQKSILDSYKKK